MKHKQSWAGAICCFVLFIVVCLSLTMHMKGAFRVAGHPEIGLLFFTLPGAVASFFSHRREVIKPLIGAMLAAPCCLVLMRFVFMPTRSVWQELAWLFSAVFWCALGALCFLFISSLFSQRRKKNR
ncbi:TPA: inner membrane protein YbjM [Citrobacter koseri]|uniref:inner membrane protein YbjM n=1 Tax=Citrobacter koseri TaxID=545 RepID=UPI001B9F7CA8|nr:inner membrane protein YbjM [Citrobacter koseri]HBC5673261.1 inner membrane protein YbjM [Citrobacter koseri]